MHLMAEQRAIVRIALKLRSRAAGPSSCFTALRILMAVVNERIVAGPHLLDDLSRPPGPSAAASGAMTQAALNASGARAR